MHVSNLVSSAPAAPRSDSRADPSHDSGFGAVYGARERRAPASDAPRGDAEGAEQTAASDAHEAGSASTKDRAPERPAAAEKPEGTAIVVEGEAPVAEVEADPFVAEVPADDADAPVAGSDTQRPEIPNDAVLAAAEPPAPRASARHAAEAETPRVLPQATRQASPPAAESAAPAEGPAPDVSAPREAPVPKVAAAQAAQPAPAAQADHAAQAAPATIARPGATEEVTVRRVRAEEQLPADRATGIRSDAPLRAEGNAPRLATAAAAPVDPLAKTSSEVARPDVVDPASAEIAPAEGRSTADQAARAEATVRHDTPRPVMQQVAEAARALRDGPVELTLKPEELGKVKMTLSAGAEGAMMLTVQTERPETLDLLRRHIGDLARELQDMGFENLSFSFGQDRASAERRNESHRDDDAGDRPIAAIPLAQLGFAARSAPAVTVGGLDIRI